MSIFQLSGMPQVVGMLIVMVAFGVLLSPYVVDFKDEVSEIVRTARLCTAFLLPCLFLPLLPAPVQARLSFAAIRVSGQDHFWVADWVRKGEPPRQLRRSADYPFSKPSAQRLTCWRCLLLEAGADPVLDVTLANASQHFFLVTKLGIEIVSVGCVPERRDAGCMQQPTHATTHGAFEVGTPNVVAMFEAARAQNGSPDTFEMDTTLVRTTELGEPFYLKPQREFRFELKLAQFCENTPLHSLVQLIVQTDRGVFRSPVLYFRR